MQWGPLRSDECVCAEDAKAEQTHELVTKLLEARNTGLPGARVQSPSAKKASVKSSTERLAWGSIPLSALSLDRREDYPGHGLAQVTCLSAFLLLNPMNISWCRFKPKDPQNADKPFPFFLHRSHLRG